MGGNGARSRTATVGAVRGRNIGMGGVGSFMGQPQQQTPPVQPPPAPGQTTPAGRVTLDQFRQMDDNQLVQYLNSIKSVTMNPVADLPNFDTQKIIYDLGLNGKPRIVSEAELNKMPGEMLFRGVHRLTDNNGTTIQDARSIAATTRYDDFSHIGAGISGDGYYFTNSKSEANNFAEFNGRHRNLGDSAVMKMKLDRSRTDMVDVDTLRRMFNKESVAVQTAFMRLSGIPRGGNGSYAWADAYLGAYALKKGYNTISRAGQHRIVLDRSIMIMSDTITPRV